MARCILRDCENNISAQKKRKKKTRQENGLWQRKLFENSGLTGMGEIFAYFPPDAYPVIPLTPSHIIFIIRRRNFSFWWCTGNFVTIKQDDTAPREMLGQERDQKVHRRGCESKYAPPPHPVPAAQPWPNYEIFLFPPVWGNKMEKYYLQRHSY